MFLCCQVWGAIPPWHSGSLCEYLVIPAAWVARKPIQLSHEEAAALPYGALLAEQTLRGERAKGGDANLQGLR